MTFEETISSKNLVVVDFYAKWCGPCKKMDPFIEKLKEKDVTFVKIDVDNDDENVSEKYNVDCMPTFIFFKEGNELDRFSGASVKKLKEYIKKYK